MADIWTKDKRSAVMSRIRSGNTKPELALRSLLFARGLRYRLHRKDLPGKPDLVFQQYKSVVFVHGCFWHYHQECREGRVPSTNTRFWQEKLSKNVARDETNTLKLLAAGWKVIVVWECEIEKNMNEQSLNNLISRIKS
jgi:DNA mismatch endonuclease (patch repair protein)